MAGRDRRAFCLAGVDIDEADMQAGEGLPALHIDDVVNHLHAVGQMAAVPPAERAGKLDVPDRVIVAVAQGETIHQQQGTGDAARVLRVRQETRMAAGKLRARSGGTEGRRAAYSTVRAR